MRYPDFLKPKGTIGFVAPAFGCATEPYVSAFASAREILSGMGYHLMIGPNCSSSDGIGISSTPQKCGEELNTFYQSEENDILISCGGGEMMCEVVPYMDFDGIKTAKPKWYVGYSDNTNFTFTLATLTDTASLYAPCAKSFGMVPWHPSLEDTIDLITGRKLCFQNYDFWELEQQEDASPTEPYHVTEPTEIKVFGAKKDAELFFEGRLIGGCMDCLENLIGTPYDGVRDFSKRYAEEGILWFLEACDLNVFCVRRTIWHMKEAGWFSHVKGFLIGRPGLYGQEIMGLDHYHAVTDLLEEYHVPILMDLDIGHHPPMMPMLCGGYAKVHYCKNHFEICYDLK